MNIRYIGIFFKKKSKILQILQLAINHLICKMYDWKYFVILLYDLHFAFYIISTLGFQNFSENSLSACVKTQALKF
jgi:hypothetical protein